MTQLKVRGPRQIIREQWVALSYNQWSSHKSLARSFINLVLCVNEEVTIFLFQLGTNTLVLSATLLCIATGYLIVNTSNASAYMGDMRDVLVGSVGLIVAVVVFIASISDQRILNRRATATASLNAVRKRKALINRCIWAYCDKAPTDQFDHNVASLLLLYALVNVTRQSDYDEFNTFLTAQLASCKAKYNDMGAIGCIEQAYHWYEGSISGGLAVLLLPKNTWMSDNERANLQMLKNDVGELSMDTDIFTLRSQVGRRLMRTIVYGSLAILLCSLSDLALFASKPHRSHLDLGVSLLAVAFVSGVFLLIDRYIYLTVKSVRSSLASGGAVVPNVYDAKTQRGTNIGSWLGPWMGMV